MGKREAPQKGYEYLIRAFSKIYKKKDVNLVILGTGYEKNKILALSKELKIWYLVESWQMTYPDKSESNFFENGETGEYGRHKNSKRIGKTYIEMDEQ